MKSCKLKKNEASGAPQSLLFHDQNFKNRVRDTSVVCTLWNIRSATISVFVFISTQMNVYTHTGSRTSRTTTTSTSNATTSDSDINDVCMYYCDALLRRFRKIKIFFFFPQRAGLFRLQKCLVTDAKVMTFTVSKCVHNLPQTSILLVKLIATK